MCWSNTPKWKCAAPKIQISPEGVVFLSRWWEEPGTLNWPFTLEEISLPDPHHWILRKESWILVGFVSHPLQGNEFSVNKGACCAGMRPSVQISWRYLEKINQSTAIHDCSPRAVGTETGRAWWLPGEWKPLPQGNGKEDNRRTPNILLWPLHYVRTGPAPPPHATHTTHAQLKFKNTISLNIYHQSLLCELRIPV